MKSLIKVATEKVVRRTGIWTQLETEKTEFADRMWDLGQS